MFSLYSLTYRPEQLDSAVDLEFSELRQQTSHIANIFAKDEEISYDGLQRAMTNLSRMFSDTLSLSIRSGSPTPCLLPLTANISDFPADDCESSLSSFQSSWSAHFSWSAGVIPAINTPKNKHQPVSWTI